MKTYFYLLVLLSVSTTIFGQKRIEELNIAQNNGITKEVTARDEIRLKPGFSSKPVGTNKFIARIDEALLCNPEYTTEITDPNNSNHPNNRVLNTGLAVGSLPGAADVSPMGGAVYNIPIALPEGVGGMTPQLAVTYNSHGGNGTMGPGWSLSGLSAVTRTGKTIYHDGAASNMKADAYGNDDRLLLDGQRLIALGSVKGLEAAEFRTETESYSRIYKESSLDSRWFRMIAKDAREIKYGETADSRTKAGTTLVWWISSVTDVEGNFIRYTYGKAAENGETYIQKIEYGNAGGTVVASVVFGYDKRNDIRKFTMGQTDNTILQSVLLKQIIIYDGNKRAGKYIFNYAYTDGVSKLVEVIPENGTGQQLNTTRFSWTAPSVSLSPSIYQTVTLDKDKEHLPFDFNGDGMTDLLEVPKTGNNWLLIKGTPSCANFGTNNISFNLFADKLSVQQHLASICSNWHLWDNNKKQIILDFLGNVYGYCVGDFDGDGVAELAVMTRKYSITDCSLIEPSYLNNLYPQGNVVCIYKFPGVAPELICRKEFPNNVTLTQGAIDFNRDGKAELKINNMIYSYDIATRTLIEHGQTDNISFDRKQWTDFNGDGRSDYISEGKSIYIQNADNYYFTKGRAIFENCYTVTDINGDGVTEILSVNNGSSVDCRYIYDPNGSYIWNADINSYMWCGSDYFNDTIFIKNPSTRYREECIDLGYEIKLTRADGSVITRLDNYFGTKPPAGVISADIDADGMPDILLCRQSGTDIIVDKIFYRFQVKADGTYGYQTADGFTLSSMPMQGDFDGDGITELVCPDGKICKFASGKPGVLLASAVDGYNQKTFFEYAPLTNTSVYTKGTGSYPIAPIVGGMQVVSSIKQDNGSVGQTTFKYGYTNGRMHLTGKGFLGYASLKTENVTAGMTIQTNVTIDNTFFVPKQTVTETKAGAQLLSEAIVDFSITTDGLTDKRFRYVPVTKKEKDMYGNLTATTYTYEAYGNVEQEKTTQDNGAYHRIVYYEGYTGPPRGIRHRPQAVTVIQKHKDDRERTVSKTTFAYSADGKARLIKKTENVHTPKPVTTEYTNFDNFGHPRTITQSASDITALTENIAYDPAGRRVESRTGAEGITRYGYDDRGRLVSQTDPAGLTVSFAYDQWGQPTETAYPDGRRESTSRVWTDNGWQTTVSATGRAPVIATYDRAGRELSTETKGPGNMSITSTNTYNAKGQLEKSISSRGNLGMATDYTYHFDGRLNTEKAPDGTVTAYTYGNRQVSTLRNSKTTVKKYDAWGNVSETTDRMGYKVSYAYFSTGLPNTITAAGVAYSMIYDEAGNQTRLTDPNAGAVDYTYDALGRVLTQKDAKNQLQTVVYDALGRTDKITIGAVVIKHEYVTENAGKGQLKKITDQSTGHSIEYAYDTYGRPVSEKRHIEGTDDIIVSFVYNAASNIASVAYPGGVTETREYDAYGNPTTVKVNGSPVWALNTFTATEISATLGNGLKTKTTYNMQGLLTGLQSTKTSSGDIRNYGYVFDAAKGILNSRTGMNGTETFGYDDLYRLKTVGGAGTMTIDYTTDGRGNIQYKTGIGEYSYGLRPHAVEEVENTAGWVSHKGQKIDYSWFHKVTAIRDTVSNNAYLLTIGYGPNRQRVKTELKKNNAVVKTVIYAGNYERITQGGVTKELYYIAGGDGLCAIVAKQSGQANKMYYVHPDHLGSLSVITDEAGDIVQKCSFDAWGKRTLVQGSLLFDRGYTGHEHIDELALINMNGRMYDPLLGRFLSPDPYVQSPLFSQSFNRYSYCWNNPLVFTDPDGEFIWFVVAGAILGSYIGGSLAAKTANITKWGGTDWWKGAIAGAFVGATAGAMLASAVGATGVTTALTNGGVGMTKAFGITSTMLNGASVNIGINAISGGGWEGAWKAGIVGALSGGWSATNGLGMLPKGVSGTFGGNLARRLGYQMIGTTGQSIGNNWVQGKSLFSRITLGVGPVNLTLGKRQNLLQWQNNLGNIAFNGLGFLNKAMGGKMSFNKEHLAFNFYGGPLGKLHGMGPTGGTGAYATWNVSNLQTDIQTYTHELGHIWQSRSDNLFMLNYFSSSIFPLLNPQLTESDSYYEQLAEDYKNSMKGFLW